MTQPADKRTPLRVHDFRDKTTPEPSLCWEIWRVQYKIALLAKRNIMLNTLLGPKPEMIELPLEPIWDERIIGSSAQWER